MHKILKIYLLAGSLLMAIPALADECAYGAGIVVEANNHRKYCLSKIPMNWWSAFAWCDAAGGTVVSATVDCIDPAVSGVGSCPNLNNASINRLYWFREDCQNGNSGGRVWGYFGTNGSVLCAHSPKNDPRTGSGSAYALCRGNY